MKWNARTDSIMQVWTTRIATRLPDSIGTCTVPLDISYIDKFCERTRVKNGNF